MRARLPSDRDVAEATVRERIHQALLDGLSTARDVSRCVGIPEHDVAAHLVHIERSLKHRGATLTVEPPTCLDCGFAFTHRQRFTKPGTCPHCRSRRIGLPRFRIKA